MTDGYSMSGSHAKSVALKPAGTFSGGKRFSVGGPTRGGSSALNCECGAPTQVSHIIARRQKNATRSITGMVNVLSDRGRRRLVYRTWYRLTSPARHD